MKQIPKEVIDNAESLFMHITKKEKEKYLNIYANEQTILSLFFQRVLATIEDKDLVNNCLNLYLIILKSYKYYGIEIPQMKEETIRDTHQRFMASLRLDEDNTPSVHETLENVKIITRQNNLMDYLILKLLGPNDNVIEYNKDNDILTACAIINIIILLFNNEMKKFLSDEIN
jgi:hypothetical protein